MTEEASEVRCPECGARNTTVAEWCTQCYTPLVVDQPEAAGQPPPAAPGAPGVPPPPAGDPVASEHEGLLPPPPPSSAADDTAPDAGDAGDADGRGVTSGLRSGGGQFRETAEGLEWICATCQQWNSIDRVTCAICSTPFGRTVGGDDEPDRPDVPEVVLTVVSLLLPGAGHWLLGMRGTAALRAMLALVWGLGGFSLLLRARASGQPVLPAIPLLIGWLVLAAGSANDAVVEGTGSGTRVLPGRVLLWLTLGVVGATFAAVLVGVLSAVG